MKSDLFQQLLRNVNSTKNCDSSVDAFPETLFNNNPPNWTVLVFTFIFSAYIFWAIGVCCRTYLVPSVQCLCDKFQIPYDIGGATFLAFSTSAPELFACIVGTFLTKSDFGISTIIGSCVFNSLVIPGVCGVFCKGTLILDWWSIARDNFWYFLSTILVSIVIYDEIVNIVECGVLLIVYIAMLLFLFYDNRIRKCCTESNDETSNEEVITEKIEEEDPKKCLDLIWGFPKNEGCCKICIWLLNRPFKWLFAFTIPKVHISFVGAFIGSIFWLAGLCYLAAWSIKLIGFHMFVPDGVMGITLMSVGTSIPEVVTSYIVSQKGMGSMSVSNAIGSNTFNNLVALPVPWLLSILVYGHNIKLDSAAMAFIAATVLFTVFFLQFALFITRYRLGRFLGWICIFVYAIFAVICIGFIIYFCE